MDTVSLSHDGFANVSTFPDMSASSMFRHGLQLLICVGVGRFVLVVCGNCFCCSVTAF